MKQGENLDDIDNLSRQQWSVVVANALMKAWERDTVDAVIAGGRDEWIRVGRLSLADQDLKRDDLSRIFDMICLRHGKVPTS